ncbi:predicted RanGDP binding protein [Leishmania donovani]|uniref:Predicted_RanGDP_binding_protein/GeneDB:LmjF.36.1 410 n=1 Tax=Leishmania donovani TaxID=5661 RepID=A0A504XBJ1_LEIDO|nr:hypothetical protein CGC20_29195 [Leishmania donovani]CAJ1993507.1 predicted RanGDP binding protein [Leishmania donovani]VDZ49333.1 predicted_RanGDP_binding_protein/GeneDB:LmjF.36.1410 [Leishmania donovani]
MQAPQSLYQHSALLRATLRAPPAIPPLLRRHRLQTLSVPWRWNRDYNSRPSDASAHQSPAQEDMLVRMLIQDAFHPASTSSLAKSCEDVAGGDEQSHSTTAGTESRSCRPSQCDTPATEGGGAGDTLGTEVQALGGGRPQPPPGAAPRSGMSAHVQDGLGGREISGSPVRVDEAAAFVTDSRAPNAAAEPFATIRRGKRGDYLLRALEWLCCACHTYNSLTSSSATCRKCEAPAVTSYRSAFPPLRHVAIAPTAWVCQNCSHTNRQTGASAQPHADRAGVARAQREKFICDQCRAPFGGVQDWVCPACDHFCPRAATQCPSCFADRPLAWTCHCCDAGVQNSVFAVKCRGCGRERRQRYSNSVVRCTACRGWNDVRWELCAACMAPTESLLLAREKRPGAEEATLPTPPLSESALGDTTNVALAADSAGMLHSKTVAQATELLEAARTSGTAATARGLRHDTQEPSSLSPSPPFSPVHADDKQPQVAVKLPDNAWWCFTCNVAHRRNVTFCDICLESRDAMRLRNKKELAVMPASASSPSTDVTSPAVSSDPAALKDVVDVMIMPATAEGDWQCPYCRKLLRVTQHQCCGHRREVPYGYWLCDHCCSTNRNDRSLCLGCNERRENVCPWTCQECEWGNDAANAVCLQCGLPRTPCETAERGTTVSDDSALSTSISCAVCSAPNHFEKTACYRCRARLRDVEWTCDACGHGHRTRNALRCEGCRAIRQFDLQEEVWLCEVCTTPVFSGGEIPVRTHCPKCNAQRAPTATHYPSRWKCECGLFNRSRVTECPECGARRRLESLSTTATCPRCFRDTPIDIQEKCTYCSASLGDCFSRWESNITLLADTPELAEACDESEADEVPDDSDDDVVTA